MHTIRKSFAFSASHVLEGLPDDHPCGRLHGHNYDVVLELQGEMLDGTGFVLDYGALAPFRHYIDSELDHRHLNDVLAGGNPTAENLAVWLYVRACMHLKNAIDRQPSGTRVSAVAVCETPKTWAEYRP